MAKNQKEKALKWWKPQHSKSSLEMGADGRKRSVLRNGQKWQ